MQNCLAPSSNVCLTCAHTHVCTHTHTLHPRIPPTTTPYTSPRPAAHTHGAPTLRVLFPQCPAWRNSSSNLVPTRSQLSLGHGLYFSLVFLLTRTCRLKTHRIFRGRRTGSCHRVLLFCLSNRLTSPNPTGPLGPPAVTLTLDFRWSITDPRQ